MHFRNSDGMIELEFSLSLSLPLVLSPRCLLPHWKNWGVHHYSWNSVDSGDIAPREVRHLIFWELGWALKVTYIVCVFWELGWALNAIIYIITKTAYKNKCYEISMHFILIAHGSDNILNLLGKMSPYYCWDYVYGICVLGVCMFTACT